MTMAPIRSSSLALAQEHRSRPGALEQQGIARVLLEMGTLFSNVADVHNLRGRRNARQWNMRTTDYGLRGSVARPRHRPLSRHA